MIVAIDPGAQGGIVYANDDFTNVRAIAMPKHDDEISFALVPEHHGKRVAYLEDLVKYTGWKMPASSMAVYAANWGFIKGVLNYCGYTIKIVPPKEWQKAVGMKKEKKEPKPKWKNRLKIKAQACFPRLKVTLSTADALLILEAASLGLLK